nr:MAG TPA: hypothetical protein [Caudoviricetes sp.]
MYLVLMTSILSYLKYISNKNLRFFIILFK